MLRKVQILRLVPRVTCSFKNLLIEM